jgi:hypothetical protein
LLTRHTLARCMGKMHVCGSFTACKCGLRNFQCFFLCFFATYSYSSPINKMLNAWCFWSPIFQEKAPYFRPKQSGYTNKHGYVPEKTIAIFEVSLLLWG